jgi:hypothetical protein
MNVRVWVFLLFTAVFFSACEKNTVSNIPQIGLLAFEPDSIRVNLDTAYIIFNLVDGDADLGNSDVSQIYWRDSRYPNTEFNKTPFPAIDAEIEDPKKGLEGKCLFIPVPQPTPRLDSVHLVKGDTMAYELYITDRANNESNHLITKALIIRL